MNRKKIDLSPQGELQAIFTVFICSSNNKGLNSTFLLVENLILAIPLVNMKLLYAGLKFARFFRVIIGVLFDQVISASQRAQGKSDEYPLCRQASVYSFVILITYNGFKYYQSPKLID